MLNAYSINENMHLILWFALQEHIYFPVIVQFGSILHCNNLIFMFGMTEILCQYIISLEYSSYYCYIHVGES